MHNLGFSNIQSTALILKINKSGIVLDASFCNMLWMFSIPVHLLLICWEKSAGPTSWTFWVSNVGVRDGFESSVVGPKVAPPKVAQIPIV